MAKTKSQPDYEGEIIAFMRGNGFYYSRLGKGLSFRFAGSSNLHKLRFDGTYFVFDFYWRPGIWHPESRIYIQPVFLQVCVKPKKLADERIKQFETICKRFYYCVLREKQLKDISLFPFALACRS